MSPSYDLGMEPDSMKLKVIDILKANGISEEVDQLKITEPKELVGEHMASASLYAEILFKNQSVKPKNLFIKTFTTNAMHTEMTKQMRIMEKEAAFFNSFLPAAKEFCKNYKGCEDMLSFFPKCLYGDDNMIILENVVLDDSFIMLDKEARQDLFTSKYVLSNLAKFHAVSFAMIQEVGRDAFKTKWETVIAEGFLGSVNQPIMEMMYDNGMNTCINILKSYPMEGGQETIDKLMGFMGKAYPMLKTLLSASKDDPMAVINHGDCWNNNMLFKLDPVTGKVNDHIFVDLQITRLGSANLDLGYFLYTSIKPEIRRNQHKELLEHYFEVFENTVESLHKKCPLTFDEFYTDYRKNAKLGFFTNVAIMAAIGAMKEIDMSTMPEDPNEMMQAWNNIIDNWVKNNPKQAGEISSELVACVKEYDLFIE